MMKRIFLSKLFQASLVCFLAVLFTACDEVFGSEDNPIPAYLSMDTSDVTLKVGDKVMFRGENTDYATTKNNDYNHIDCDKNIKVYGNIMSLIKKTGFETVTALTAVHAFRKLFMANANLIDASDLLLPAETLTDFCYREMFYNCTSLTTAPKELPATSLAENCCSYMFASCAALTTVPVELPATVMKDYCYGSMFYGCTSLTTAPKLPATTLVNRCYNEMFFGCTNLSEAWVKADYTNTSNECGDMFYGVTATGKIHTSNHTTTNWTTKKPANWTVSDEDYNP